MIEAAERSGALQPGGTIIEATGGNTGVGLAMIAAARGYRAILTMPSNISQDKQATMRTFGAQVVLCPSVPFADPNHFYQTAKRLSEETPGAVWVNQFENMANSQAHYETTGPEIWAATGGRVDALVVSAGTGGTISGLSRFFKERLPNFKAFLIDPYGAGLYEYVRSGKIASEGSSVAYEGIGIMRLTANFAAARVDGAFRGTDREGVEMCYWLLRNEGLWVGPSAALNVVGAVKVARQLGPGHTIVTVLCDSGSRYQNTVFNKEWLDKHNLAPLSTGTDLGFVL
jgi:cysteine synthase A